ARLYAGDCDSLILLEEWDSDVSDSGVNEIRISYPSLGADSTYYLMLIRPSVECGSYTIMTPSPLIKNKGCGDFCSLIYNGNFEDIDQGCREIKNNVNLDITDSANDFNLSPFAPTCVKCWSCSHGS